MSMRYRMKRFESTDMSADKIIDLALPLYSKSVDEIIASKDTLKKAEEEIKKKSLYLLKEAEIKAFGERIKTISSDADKIAFLRYFLTSELKNEKNTFKRRELFLIVTLVMSQVVNS